MRCREVSPAHRLGSKVVLVRSPREDLTHSVSTLLSFLSNAPTTLSLRCAFFDVSVLFVTSVGSPLGNHVPILVRRKDKTTKRQKTKPTKRTTPQCHNSFSKLLQHHRRNSGKLLQQHSKQMHNSYHMAGHSQVPSLHVLVSSNLLFFKSPKAFTQGKNLTMCAVLRASGIYVCKIICH